MARPRSQRRIRRYRVTITLYEDEDKDLILIMDGAAKGDLPQTIKTRMRMGIEETAVSSESIDEGAAINALLSMMQ